MRIAAFSLAVLATACVGAPDTRPINVAMSAPLQAPGEIDLGVDGDAIALALSGGGARAASFSLGVLQQLRDTRDAQGRPLIDKVALVTAVSGGSIIAAYFGQHGAAGLDGFRAAALDKDWQGQLHTTWASPMNWERLLQGGLNGPDKLADWLDKEVFAGGLMRDMPGRPRVVINAADLYNGTPFAFAAPYFQAICSDLGGVRIADAVAASMSVPIAFRPVVLKSYAENCPADLPAWVEIATMDRGAPMLLRETAQAFEMYRDPAKMRYLHLTDGGVADNFGLSSLVTLRRASQTPYGPFSVRDGVKIKRLTFLVVNSEKYAAGDWALKEAGPDGPQVVEAVMSAAVNAPKRAASDAFGSMLSDWQGELIAWRCSLSIEQARQLGAGEGWDCRDVQFRMDTISFADLSQAHYDRLGAADTAVSLPKDLIDDLIKGGREAVQINAAVRALTR
jgi:NTE family protein